MYDYEPAEVSRRRAAAIERLADDLRVQRGEDLGSVLKALLEPGTWAGIEPAPGREFTVPGRSRSPTSRRRPRRARTPSPTPTPLAAEAASAHEPLPAPVPLRPVPRPEPEPEKAPKPPPATLAAVADPPKAPPPDEPVLDMLAEGRRGDEGSGRRVRTLPDAGQPLAPPRWWGLPA